MQTDPWTRSGFCHCKTVLASHSEILCQSWCSRSLTSVKQREDDDSLKQTLIFLPEQIA